MTTRCEGYIEEAGDYTGAIDTRGTCTGYVAVRECCPPPSPWLIATSSSSYSRTPFGFVPLSDLGDGDGDGWTGGDGGVDSGDNSNGDGSDGTGGDDGPTAGDAGDDLGNSEDIGDSSGAGDVIDDALNDNPFTFGRWGSGGVGPSGGGGIPL